MRCWWAAVFWSHCLSLCLSRDQKVSPQILLTSPVFCRGPGILQSWLRLKQKRWWFEGRFCAAWGGGGKGVVISNSGPTQLLGVQGLMVSWSWPAFGLPYPRQFGGREAETAQQHQFPGHPRCLQQQQHNPYPQDHRKPSCLLRSSLRQKKTDHLWRGTVPCQARPEVCHCETWWVLPFASFSLRPLWNTGLAAGEMEPEKWRWLLSPGYKDGVPYKPQVVLRLLHPPLCISQQSPVEVDRTWNLGWTHSLTSV